MAVPDEPPFWRELLWQDDVVSRAQLAQYGVTDSWIRARISSGRWQRLFPGTYLARGGPVDYRSRIWAGVLYGGEPAVASHESAGFLVGLADQPPDEVHIALPHGRQARTQPGLVVHRSVRPLAIRVGRPPVTSAESTVLDLVGGAGTEAEVVALITRAFAKGAAHPARLSTELARRGRQRWRRLVTEIAMDGVGIESALEWRYLRDVERRHALPRPLRQAPVRVAGTRPARRDVYYEAQRVVIELDGRRGHVGLGAFRDAARDNAATLRGEITLRFGWIDVVATPCEVAVQVATVLTARGWAGEARSCGPTCALNATRTTT